MSALSQVCHGKSCQALRQVALDRDPLFLYVPAGSALAVLVTLWVPAVVSSCPRLNAVKVLMYVPAPV